MFVWSREYRFWNFWKDIASEERKFVVIMFCVCLFILEVIVIFIQVSAAFVAMQLDFGNKI